MIDIVTNGEINFKLIKELTDLFEQDINEDVQVNIDTENMVITLGKLTQPILGTTNAEIKLSIYKLLLEYTSSPKPWGTLTGVKPVKRVITLLEDNLSHDKAYKVMKDKYMLSDSRFELAYNCAINQQKLLYVDKSTASLYIHIPLCVSKCSYCSFPSTITTVGSELCDSYLDSLLIELDELHKLNLGFTYDTVYIGGGTPSILSTSQLEKLLLKVVDYAPNLEEYSVEAGRADTLDFAKLKLLKDMGVTRLSLNPQTSNNATLKALNRTHTYSDFLKSFNTAREIGFNNINCDLILGLAQEGLKDFDNSIHSILQLEPENITIHSLCKKRTSELSIKEVITSEIDISEYMTGAIKLLESKGYYPYYMYKQKNAKSYGENIGFSKKGYECIYNIRMMGDSQSIISAGANSTTKFYFKDENRFETIHNVKELRIYNSEIDRVIEKKIKLINKTI